MFSSSVSRYRRQAYIASDNHAVYSTAVYVLINFRGTYDKKENASIHLLRSAPHHVRQEKTIYIHSQMHRGR